MSKIIINVPVLVECDLQSFRDEDEQAFQIEKTDFIKLSNIVVGDMIIPATGIVVIE